MQQIFQKCGRRRRKAIPKTASEALLAVKNDNMKEEQVFFKVTLLEENPECSWNFEKIELRRFVVPKVI